jgi:hypothetical protein
MLNLSPQNKSRPPSVLSKLVIAVVLLFTLAITASAYTLVFRNGQRMEIPTEFTLTRTTLTFEISPGFNKTMLLSLVDVAATERANNQAPGSFFKQRAQAPVVTGSAPRATRTVTNSDLASVRQRRIASEQAYEARRKELGLPTVEETRKRQDEEGAVLRQQLREKSAAMVREETYWRERARDLRREIATVDTQINYLRGRLTEVNDSLIAGSVVTEIYPLWPNNRQWHYPNQRNRGYRPARPTYGLGLPYPYGYPQYPYQYPQYPMGPFDNFDNSSQQKSELTNRLDDLLVRRAGLSAEWRALEDEARDARVPQVWLEP